MMTGFLKTSVFILCKNDGFNVALSASSGQSNLDFSSASLLKAFLNCAHSNIRWASSIAINFRRSRCKRSTTPFVFSLPNKVSGFMMITAGRSSTGIVKSKVLSKSFFFEVEVRKTDFTCSSRKRC